MSDIQLQNIAKSFGQTPVLRGIDLHIQAGEFVALVGPSGCGKSTLLRILAGLDWADVGRILIGGQDLTLAPPKARNVAMVFQNYALYPHMTVAENIGFGLRVRGTDTATRDAAVRQAAALLELDHLLDRHPKALSGGQRQRVAMGRAIVREPSVFLMDEPLSNLDAQLRNTMRQEIRALQQRLGVTTLYVTHDQVEAMTMADRIVVLNQGVIQQVGTPDELYEQPANLFVAQFIGAPRMNILPTALLPERGPLSDHATHVGIRPHHVRLLADDQDLRAARSELDIVLPALVQQREPLGDVTVVHTRVQDQVITVRHDGKTAAREGHQVYLGMKLMHCQGFDAQGQAVSA